MRTVSLTQNGMRQRTNRIDFGRPRATFAMYHATGNAIASVQIVAKIDIVAVRTNVCQ